MAAPLSAPQCTAVGVGTAEPGPSAARGAPPLAAVLTPTPHPTPHSPEQTGPPRTLPRLRPRSSGEPAARRPRPWPREGAGGPDAQAAECAGRELGARGRSRARRGAGLRNRPHARSRARRAAGAAAGQGGASLPRRHLEKWRTTEGKVAGRWRAPSPPRRGACFCLGGKNAQGSLHSAAHGLGHASVGYPRAGCAPGPVPGPVFPTLKLCGRNREVVWPPLSQLLRNKEAAAAAYVSLLWESLAPCSVREP